MYMFHTDTHQTYRLLDLPENALQLVCVLV